MKKVEKIKRADVKIDPDLKWKLQNEASRLGVNDYEVTEEAVRRILAFTAQRPDKSGLAESSEPRDGTVPVPVPKSEKNGNRHKEAPPGDSLSLLSLKEVQWIQILRDQPKLADALLELMHGRKANHVPPATPADLEKRIAKLGEKQDPPGRAQGGNRNTGT